jgi:hypothetical protein
VFVVIVVVVVVVVVVYQPSYNNDVNSEATRAQLLRFLV